MINKDLLEKEQFTPSLVLNNTYICKDLSMYLNSSSSRWSKVSRNTVPNS